MNTYYYPSVIYIHLYYYSDGFVMWYVGFISKINVAVRKNELDLLSNPPPPPFLNTIIKNIQYMVIF